MIKLIAALAALVSVSPSATQQRVERHGYWDIETYPEFVGAYTTNAEGNVFGTICGKGCAAYTSSLVPCEDREVYPALVNSPSGSFHVSFECVLVGKDNHILTTDLTPQFIDAYEIGGEIGVAYPMRSGNFSVAKYSLVGAMRATRRAAEIASDRDKQPETPQRNFT